MRLRSYLLLVAAAGLVPGFMAALFAVEQVREGERQAALRGLHETVRATALLVDREIEGSLRTLEALGNSASLKTGNLSAFHDQAAALDRRPDVWSVLFDASGLQLVNTSRPFDASRATVEEGDAIARVLATQRPVVSDLTRGKVTGKLMNTVYVPARAMNGYVVAHRLSVELWQKKAVVLPESRAAWLLAVIDRNGKFITRSQHADQLIGRQARLELVAAAAASAEGLIRHRTLENVDVYDAFTHSELTGWTIAVAAPVDTIEASSWLAVSSLIAGLAVALAAGAAMATHLSRKFLRGIEVASAAAAAIGKGEQPTVSPTTLYEINALNIAIDDAGRLLAAERKSREAAEAERARLLEAEIAARETAQKENAAKDQFLALLGHELRNPLAGIAGATSLLQRKGHEAAAADRYLAIIQRQNRHLTHIVDDLLDVSRVALGKIVLQSVTMNLADCVASCVDGLRVTERAAGHRLVVEADDVWVHADAVRIEQIVNNLVANALKFSASGSEVHLRVLALESTAVIEVIDRGVGIAPDLLPHVFEPFRQGPGPLGRLQSGLGIGLALVKQLVQLHGGQVSVQSQGAGTGSTFVVSLPRVERADPTPAVQTGPVTTPCRVLLVEDNPDARATTAQSLRDMGYSVEVASDGHEALAIAAQWMPEVVVLDIGLPDLDGYTVAAALRQRSENGSLVLIALSGYGGTHPRRNATPQMFDEHLVKPAPSDVLARSIEDQLKRRRPSQRR
jgi:signal transduction histidine kinase/CheY-like chemotaxis protein